MDERSAQHKDRYLPIDNTHNRQTSMPPGGIETTVPTSKLPQTLAVDGAATWIDENKY